MSTYTVHDTITADEVEDGDQIIIDGDLLENVRVESDPDDISAVIIVGYSDNTGDVVRYPLPYDYTVELWAI
jgi:hypothetical protein